MTEIVKELPHMPVTDLNPNGYLPNAMLQFTKRLIPGLLCVCFICSAPAAYGQNGMKWINPLSQGRVIHSQGFEVSGFHRLPDEACDKVRIPVWDLSRHSAGLEIRFQTNAPEIRVRYTLNSDRLQMPHMPATGVSGLDLYTRDHGGDWFWVRGSYVFSDTVSYHFRVYPQPHQKQEYKLYLPLYNEVSHLELGFEEGFSLEVIPVGSELPILVYGTSIAQGACASRPGMAWPAILGRQLNSPVINLGFSGNGRLEPEVLEYVAANRVRAFLLDCLPNLVPSAQHTEQEIKSRLAYAVHFLRQKHPDTPIVLVEHAGYADAFADREREQAVSLVNAWSREVYSELQQQGIEKIYLLTREEIGLSMDATVDGTHPTDMGMQQYANAYARLLREILP